MNFWPPPAEIRDQKKKKKMHCFTKKKGKKGAVILWATYVSGKGVND